MRNEIKKDAVNFLIPAFVVFSSGVSLSGWHVIKTGNFEWSPLTIVGLCLVLSGLVTSVAAAVTLGRFYSSPLRTRKNHRVIKNGVYKFVRHPVYLGTLLAAFGIPMFVNSLVSFLVMLLFIPLIIRRIEMEEQMLVEELGDEYRNYMESTSKLIPGIL